MSDADSRPGRPSAEQSAGLSRRTLLSWLWRLPVIAALGGGIASFFYAYQVHFGKEAPAAEPTFAPTEPQPVAPLSELAGPWDAAEFTVAGLPAVALRLPEPVPGALTVDGAHYAAFSRVCTHLGCLVALNRDPEAVAFAFNYRPAEPALVCHCHLSVFLPDEGGKAVSGPAVGAPAAREARAPRRHALRGGY